MTQNDLQGMKSQRLLHDAAPAVLPHCSLVGGWLSSSHEGRLPPSADPRRSCQYPSEKVGQPPSRLDVFRQEQQRQRHAKRSAEQVAGAAGACPLGPRVCRYAGRRRAPFGDPRIQPARARGSQGTSDLCPVPGPPHQWPCSGAPSALAYPLELRAVRKPGDPHGGRVRQEPLSPLTPLQNHPVLSLSLPPSLRPPVLLGPLPPSCLRRHCLPHIRPRRDDRPVGRPAHPCLAASNPSVA